jgi:hypothetical protein
MAVEDLTLQERIRSQPTMMFFNPAFDFACILGYTDDDEPDLVLLKVIWNMTFLLILLCG